MSRKSLLNDYFNFSRGDRFGIVVLCGCILLMLTFRWSLPYLVKSQSPDTVAFEEDIALFRKAADSVYFVKNQTETTEQLLTSRFFYFDPNRISDDEWGKLGLNERQIRNIRNYQAKGGHFKRKEDMQKLYTIPAAQYQLLEPYIRIAVNEPAVKQATPEISVSDKKDITGNTARKFSEKESLVIELNTADSALLTQLSGIGPVLAARTIKYRRRIGGFADVSQLGEVYGVGTELVELLASQLSVDRSLVKKIAVNTATLRELTNHPYLNEQQARGILNYRKLQNRINSPDELVQNHILKPEEAEKMEPYLAFD